MWNGSIKQNATGGEVAECLCKQVMRRRPERASLRYSSERGEYLMYCPTCKIRTYPASNKASVIAEWNGMNRGGDPYVAELWFEKYHNQQNEPVSVKHTDSDRVTTDTR